MYFLTQVENGYTLIDPSGQPTTWGRWNPDYVNYNASAHDDRGRQSLEMLGYLLSAFRLTNRTLYIDAIHTLVSNVNQYDLNMINAVRTEAVCIAPHVALLRKGVQLIALSSEAAPLPHHL